MRAPWRARARSSDTSAVLRAGGRSSPGWLDRVPLVRVALLAIAIRVLAALLAFGANIAFPLDIKRTVHGLRHHARVLGHLRAVGLGLVRRHRA